MAIDMQALRNIFLSKRTANNEQWLNSSKKVKGCPFIKGGIQQPKEPQVKLLKVRF